ncbi:hypothetical protein NDU88_004432 [Pleurodeles waltl]|uniref:Uncharacterized protein n=1 Tax=Pleurodeles waltl TaxID=8319 RepID=A0AAV7VIY1_PLEWA|nr:hypothetical protein NDU88_004432 [Pleurodeles waltl]
MRRRLPGKALEWASLAIRGRCQSADRSSRSACLSPAPRLSHQHTGSVLLRGGEKPGPVTAAHENALEADGQHQVRGVRGACNVGSYVRIVHRDVDSARF